MDHILDFSAENKVFLVILSREKPDHGSPLFVNINNAFSNQFASIQLDHISDLAASELISNILKVENLSENVRNLIISKGQGNPFYVSELVKSFIPKGHRNLSNIAHRFARGQREKLILPFFHESINHLKKDGKIMILLHSAEPGVIKKSPCKVAEVCDSQKNGLLLLLAKKDAYHKQK